MSRFEGFPPETLKFLKGLERNNKKEWFEAHRSDYNDYVLEPAREFVVVMGERLPSTEAVAFSFDHFKKLMPIHPWLVGLDG